MSRTRKPDANIHGVMVVDKPAGFTSFDVIAKLRGMLGTRKIGHSGTLDPMATGVLPIFVGGATKAVDMQRSHDKTYCATLRFGLSTDTGDITGQVLETGPAQVAEADFCQALASFQGPRMQTPPMYSAVKINGVPLYKLARQGQTVERPARPVTIYETVYQGQNAQGDYTFQVRCSKGTYIRTLVEELGQALGCPAVLCALRRTQAGEYTLADACTLEQIQTAADAGAAAGLLRPVSTVFRHWPQLHVTAGQAAGLRNGAACTLPAADGQYAAFLQGAFLGAVTVEAGQMQVIRLFENM